MKTVIITNNSLQFYSGSELITIDLCNYFGTKSQYKAYLAVMNFGNPLAQYVNKKVAVINLKKNKLPIHTADLIIGHHQNVIDTVLRQVQCPNVWQTSLSPFVGIESYHPHITRAFANSHETKLAKQLTTSLEIEVFVNSCNDSFCLAQPKQLNKTIKKIAIVSNHNWYKERPSRPNVTVVGGTKGKLVTADLLKSYDVVITIGRTVQQCLCLGIPVYCYDRFGGPGYITPQNIDFNENLNFSGRQQPSNFTIIQNHNYAKIFNDIYTGYTKVLSYQQELTALARTRYRFSANLDKILKDF